MYLKGLLHKIGVDESKIDEAKDTTKNEIDNQVKELIGLTFLPNSIIRETIQSFYEFEKNIEKSKSIQEIRDFCNKQIGELFNGDTKKATNGNGSIEQYSIGDNQRESIKNRINSGRDKIRKTCVTILKSFKETKAEIIKKIEDQKRKTKKLTLLKKSTIDSINEYLNIVEEDINSAENLDSLKEIIEEIFKGEKKYRNEPEHKNSISEEEINSRIEKLLGLIIDSDDRYLSHQTKNDVENKITQWIYGVNGLNNMIIPQTLKEYIILNLNKLSTIIKSDELLKEIKSRIKNEEWSNYLFGKYNDQIEGINLDKIFGSDRKNKSKEEISNKFVLRKNKISEMPIPKALKKETIHQLDILKNIFLTNNSDYIEEYFKKKEPVEEQNEPPNARDDKILGEIESIKTSIENTDEIKAINKKVKEIKKKYTKKIIDKYKSEFEKIDAALAKYVSNLIDSISKNPPYTAAYINLVKESRVAYNSLTDYQKSLVDKIYMKLILAENEKASEIREVEDKDVNYVISEINNLEGLLLNEIKNITKYEFQIKNTSALYNNLSNEQKKLVYNQGILKQVNIKLNEAKKMDEEKNVKKIAEEMLDYMQKFIPKIESKETCFTIKKTKDRNNCGNSQNNTSDNFLYRGHHISIEIPDNEGDEQHMIELFIPEQSINEDDYNNRFKNYSIDIGKKSETLKRLYKYIKKCGFDTKDLDLLNDENLKICIIYYIIFCIKTVSKISGNKYVIKNINNGLNDIYQYGDIDDSVSTNIRNYNAILDREKRYII